MRKRDLLLTFIFFSAIAVLPAEVFASVIINEIAWMGSEVAGVEPKNWWRYEWFELYNNTNAPISLNGWRLELYRTELDWSLDLNGTIPAGDYFLVAASDKIPNYDLNYSNLGGKFINTGQKVLLKDGAGNIVDIIDAFSYGRWFSGNNETKQTMERRSADADGNDPANWQTSQSPGGTAKAPNSAGENTTSNNEQSGDDSQTTIDGTEQETNNQPTANEKAESEDKNPQPTINNQIGAIYPDGILINELLPSPEGPDEEQEWIEIFNQNNVAVDLSGWQIQDTMGSVKTYVFPEYATIGPNSFLVLSRPTTGITLNNSGDGVRLLKPNGNIANEVAFDKAPNNQSYNRTADEWTWSETLTPGSANIVSGSAQENDGMESADGSDAAEMTRVDINTAPLEDLMRIAHIGEGRAEELISLRPFYSLDDLARIRGIGDKAVEDIKKQGLAWIDPALEREGAEKDAQTLAALTKPTQGKGSDRQIPNGIIILLAALGTAIFSGIAAVLLKIKFMKGGSV